MDDFLIDNSVRPAVEKTGPWRLVGAMVVALACLAVPFFGSLTACIVAYAVVLVVATGLLAWHRWTDGIATQSPNYAPVAWLKYLAMATAVLIVSACALNAFFWATEVSKL